MTSSLSDMTGEDVKVVLLHILYLGCGNHHWKSLGSPSKKYADPHESDDNIFEVLYLSAVSLIPSVSSDMSMNITYVKLTGQYSNVLGVCVCIHTLCVCIYIYIKYIYKVYIYIYIYIFKMSFYFSNYIPSHFIMNPFQ